MLTNEELADERAAGDVVVTISRKGWYQGMLRHPEWLRCPGIETIDGDPGRDARSRAA